MSTRKNYDTLGITFSILCGVHCLITPILIVNFPKMGERFESPWVQAILLIIIALVFYQSVIKNFMLHKSRITLILGALGFLTLISTYVMELLGSHGEHHGHHHHHHQDETITIALAIVGSLLMISSHILNMKYCKCLKVTDE